ncbi:MAG: T9SS type A sorting domain-containing protein [Saprospiraceae bacterium]|nr:T9SS type A sorting domain-containing protein [Saprospiraceae bacterium]
MKTIITLLTALHVLVFTQNTNAQTYVNAAATGNNDGTSWADAYNELATALDNYSPGDEIWVAAGTYLPQQPSAWTGEPKQTFYLYQDVKLYGGFNGTETLLSERDPAANITILSGDLNGNDVVDDFGTNREDNVINVVYIGTAITTATVIDGFTISGGHADISVNPIHRRSGSGIFSLGSPQIANCRITQNYAVGFAGGMYLLQGASAEASLTGCTFESNRADIYGGGLGIATYDWDKVVHLNNCQFIGNSTGLYSGGMDIESSWVDLSNCQFTQNRSESAGGGLLFVQFDAAPSDYRVTLNECDFESNISGRGGAFFYGAEGLGGNTFTFNSCNFTGNQAVVTSEIAVPNGGGVEITYNVNNPSNDSIIITDCVFQGNSSEAIGGGIDFFNKTGSGIFLDISNGQYLENSSIVYGGGFNLTNFGAGNTGTNFTGCLFENNTSSQGAGISYNLLDGVNNNFNLTFCDFQGNKALESASGSDPDGGGFYVNYYGQSILNDTIIVVDCTFQGNTAERLGGGIAFFNSFGTDNHFELNNCEIIGNAAGADSEGGGIAIIESANTTSVLVRNTHFSGNTAEEVQGFFIYSLQGSPVPQSRHVELVNCLFTDHNPNSSNAVVAAVQNAELILTSCTFADNDCPATSIYPQSVNSKLTLQNTILQSGSHPDFFNVPGSANFEVISLGGNLFGSDALDAYLNSTDQSGADPLFEAGTYQLSQNSPAVDAGVLPDNPPATDLAGNDRIQGGCIDIGAFESPYDAGAGCLTDARESLADPSTIFIYPNPVAATASVSIENGWRSELNLRIVNALGQVVRTLDFDKYDQTAVLEFDTSGLPQGIYRALVSNGERVVIANFVKL